MYLTKAFKNPAEKYTVPGRHAPPPEPRPELQGERTVQMDAPSNGTRSRFHQRHHSGRASARPPLGQQSTLSGTAARDAYVGTHKQYKHRALTGNVNEKIRTFKRIEEIQKSVPVVQRLTIREYQERLPRIPADHVPQYVV